ncbi:hypothetical protein MPNT_100055 [Candidatus Methylacidithermus pantelleriae]|uniref:Uncharacterized protein n=1 Tax=Candidatus Methylacidithermus pantelleriae TaxID=2744239 RepID=A0A8J2FRW2_9BACT|nr:hypothetical protein MPNT_100055 [Candidatus Methylacidithermus pantelleriae]
MVDSEGNDPCVVRDLYEKIVSLCARLEGKRSEQKCAKKVLEAIAGGSLLFSLTRCVCG